MSRRNSELADLTQECPLQSLAEAVGGRAGYPLQMIEIRPAVQDDAPEMARVIVDTWFAAHKGQVTNETFQQRRDEWGYTESEQGWRRSIREADGVFVAIDKDQVVGVAAGAITAAECAEVAALYVAVSQQRSGIGRRLVEETIAHYRGLGISTLHIAVLATNQPARRFYENLGGLKAGTRDAPDGLEIVYAWDLANVESNVD